MRKAKKFLVIVILLVFALPIFTASASGDQRPNGETDNEGYDYLSSHVFNLDGEQIFFDVGLTRGTDNTQSIPLQVRANGFLYEFVEYVKTKGNEDVPAYATQEEFDDDEFQKCFSDMQTNFPDVEIIGDPTSSYNCHSYAWYSATQDNTYCIFDITNYINDAHTELVPEGAAKMAGDIVVYKNANDRIQHSAIIAEINEDGTIICTSKWGASVLCNHELGDVPNNYLANGTLNCDYYRITQHVWETITNGNGKHTISCSVCEIVRQVEDCNLNYTNYNTYYHKGTCTDCGYAESPESCQATYSYVGNGSGKHTATCSKCKKSVTMNCSLEYTWYTGSRHRASCTVCAKAFYENCNVSVTYTGNGSTSHTHTLGCDECGHVTGTANTACTLSFVFAGTVNGSNTHHYACTVCGHKAASYSPCVYKNGNTCFACGTSKDTTSTAATGEMDATE